MFLETCFLVLLEPADWNLFYSMKHFPLVLLLMWNVNSALASNEQGKHISYFLTSRPPAASRNQGYYSQRLVKCVSHYITMTTTIADILAVEKKISMM